ncbi:4-(cytidine 5'-diphospho)-2-C-methyl-D-erythritol kinase [Desertimonas flava]|uniref:4-(cytidine 5'-diphospho)-2-C-methyl-D-erythritol kinase n=1 Tax=Desertimonas flava TaxID=2064846 RepID=UPI001878E057|nr:4-(cytidine 5'-diphospho)-2-C-methyl-D-erythritol kinase [Desertimonas flava]
MSVGADITFEPQVLRALAKLTCSLRVTSVRPDGYHLIDAEMVTLDLADTLRVEPAVAESSLVVSGPFADGVPTDRSNLVLKALDVVGRTAAVHAVKQIPNGGGLGGGSADAAAILRWAGVTDLEVAVGLGADVPFCLVGGRARVLGIGERIEPMTPTVRTFTLVVPPLSVSTPAVYRAWDELGGPTADGPNDLEPAAVRVEPRLSWWRDRIGSLVGSTPVLAGSGATWFVEGSHAETLAPTERDGATVIETTTSA